jgi:putative phosphonate metabolism protein
MHRYAIYFAPASASPLWLRAATWLGRDAEDPSVELAPPPGIDRASLHAQTQSARRYGFHATLKAPMILNAGTTFEELDAALSAYAETHAQVGVGPVEIRSLDGFLAIVPKDQPQALTDFTADVVTHFEPFRQPLAAGDRDSRAAKGLSRRQIELLDQYGYPYVMEEFRFHMTLTDRLPEIQRQTMMDVAQSWFAPALIDQLMLDRLSLFAEPEKGAPFVRVADYPLTSQVAL